VWQLVVPGFRSDLPRLVSREKLAAMSALPPKADIAGRDWDVRFVPKAQVGKNIPSNQPARRRYSR
jgi:hypothetical protein